MRHSLPSIADGALTAKGRSLLATHGATRRDAGEALLAICDVMSVLRSAAGCEWDRAQTLASLQPYLREEAAEVHEAIDDLGAAAAPADPETAAHRDELGDLLLQIVFQTEIQREHGAFDFADVARSIAHKMLRRHPHIFTDGPARPWAAIKAEEAALKGAPRDPAPSALGPAQTTLSALDDAAALGRGAHAVGFDWPDHVGVLDKIREETTEVEAAIDSGRQEEIDAEIGDLLYAVVNLCRHTGTDPQRALRGTMHKFRTRFAHVETRLAERGLRAETQSLDALEALWSEAKSKTR